MLDKGMRPELLRLAIAAVDAPAARTSVYQLTLASQTHAAVAEWQRAMKQLYDQVECGQVLTLTDARRSVLPALSYATLLGSLWHDYEHRRLRSRNAIVCTAAPPPEADAVLPGLPGHGNNVVRFFPPGEAQWALRWLVGDD